MTMAIQDKGSVRALALVGPTSAGKTALMEALLEAATGQAVRPGEIGDSSPEARAHGHSVELNMAGFDFMGDRYVIVDCPGSLEFCAETDAVLPAVDLAVVVADPDPAKAILLQPTLRELERLGVPHLRPSDYLAEMLKTDEHMKRVKDTGGHIAFLGGNVAFYPNTTGLFVSNNPASTSGANG